jgi:predicted metal-binding protein
MKKDLDILLADLKHIHSDFKLIPTDKIEVAEWVRWKCRYGCKAYGKHLNCPPYVPSPEETRRLIQCYDKAILARFEAIPNTDVPPYRIHHYLWDAIKELYDTMFEFERHAFLSGYYKAFAMVGLCCSYCDECIPEREKTVLDQAPKRFCEHPHKMRPGMEACGIDVFKTVRNVGYELEVLTSPYEKITFFGLLLLE